METSKIIELIKEVSKSSITKFKYSDEKFSLELEADRSAGAACNTELLQNLVQTEDETIEDEKECEVIESKLVGTFYESSKEGGEPFVCVGDTVKKGQVIGIIEAMKLMNEIESPYDGTVLEILVKNNEVIGYSQPLIKIKK